MMEGGASELAVVAKLEECMEENVDLDTRELEVDVSSVGVRDLDSESLSSRVDGEYSESVESWSME
jgi:hypothetical protein